MSSAPSRSNADEIDDALAAATTAVVERVRAIGAANPVVIVDGRSGAGKSSLARRIVAAWPLRGRVQLVALDDLYPGWDGLAEGAEYARDTILTPHAKGLVGVWRRWDWEAGERDEAQAIDPSLALIVEGAGVLTPSTARLADLAVWVDAPSFSRKHRALDRDGETYRPHWQRWAAQEDAHIERNDPVSLANLFVRVP
ncbi:aminobenzoate synthetase [Microbacterium testaceum]|uniref:Aminobenzoate synthetase n=1 Tax=Microbacterium testaceum TaxID=2033 RepID=A0A147EUP9_MICTE|nr:aminobenzoate synthetase [Microbacterium testaceum]KTR93033.1 aminobenzoate synthetase [Microbacterium testaceum]